MGSAQRASSTLICVTSDLAVGVNHLGWLYLFLFHIYTGSSPKMRLRGGNISKLFHLVSNYLTTLNYLNTLNFKHCDTTQ